MARSKREPDTFASRLRRALAEADVSAYQLAQLTDIPRMTLGRYLRGIREPSLGSAVKIARALGISIEALIPEEEL